MTLFPQPNDPWQPKQSARASDPQSSHDKAADMTRKATSNQARVLTALGSLGSGWWSTKAVTERLNRRLGDAFGPMQERDVSRVFTTMWRNRQVQRQMTGPKGKQRLHYRIPAIPYHSSNFQQDPLWWQPTEEPAVGGTLTPEEWEQWQRFKRAKEVEIDYVEHIEVDGYVSYMALDLYQVIRDGAPE